MNSAMGLRTWVGILVVSAFGLLLALAACQVTVAPAGDGGVKVGFTIAGKTFTVELGDAGVFDLAAAGEPVRKQMSVQLFTETPTDEPADAAFVVNVTDVEIVSAGTEAQKSVFTNYAVPDGTSVQVRAYVALGTSDNPCSAGSLAMEFELRQVNGRTVMYRDGQPVDVRAIFRLGASKLGLVRSGWFSLCLEVSSDDGPSRIVINRFGVTYLDEEEPPDDNANANDNQNANDNGSTNTNDNANDNVDEGNVNDNVDDNGDPVNPLDPDGDGNFDAQVCDAWDWVQVSAESPPRYSGSPGNVACLAKIHFQNTGSGNVVIWWHVTKEVPATGTVTEDGWYSTGLGPGQQTHSVESAWVYSTENDTLLRVTTSEVIVSRYDNEYEQGCLWLNQAIHADVSAVDVYRINVTGLNPCN